ncbi:hypothetical protein VQ02_17315 [Methylobacterium variabile]|uniref:Uncharacterized protein n=1 Tax=Methylobacterium variabile TaxID=298794 RepID=A0A0J6SPY6_9HYPH|nr:hypothetical protein [Methylobacterium variabile]KMO35443.1 hypothetical protein VQ02_17315 [Methylobacterium variabile]
MPAGFVLDQTPAEPLRQGSITDYAVPGVPQLSTIIKGVYASAVGGATLPGDVYAGRVDPYSNEGIDRARDLAGIAAPLTPASRAALAPIAPAAPQAVRDAADLGIALTAGQRTADPVLLSTENAMFGGAKGPAAQRVAQEAVQRQQEQIAVAKGAIGDMAGRGQADLARAADAGDAVSQGVKQAAAEAKQGYQQRYSEAFAQPGELDPRVFTGAAPTAEAAASPVVAQIGDAATASRVAPQPQAPSAPLSQRITESLVNRPEPVIIDPTLTPAANRALAELDTVSNLQLGTIGQPGAGDEVLGVSLRGVDQARRKLAAYSRAAATNPADKRAVGAIINEFDGQIQNAMENGLFSGSDEALGALQEARKAFASYQRTFKPQGAGDDVGNALRAIIERDATPEQVANYLYGAAKIGATGLSVRMADRLKGVLGEGSAEWAAVRQGAWQRVLGSPDTGVKRASDRIFDFVRGEGRSLSTRLFSPDELAQMTKLANVLRAIASKPGTVNPSGSGNRLAALARETFAATASMLGASTGGIPGAALGYVAGKGAGAFSSALAARQAEQLFAGQVPVSLGARLAQGLGAAGASTARRIQAPAAQDVLPGALSTLDPFRRLQGPVPGYAGQEQQ